MNNNLPEKNLDPCLLCNSVVTVQLNTKVASSRQMSAVGNQLLAAHVQEPAPEFRGTAVVNGSFKELSLSDFKGRYLVLFFYPLDL